MKVYAVVSHSLVANFYEEEFDLFFTTKEKAELRKVKLTKNKDGKSYKVKEIEVGE